MQYNTTTTKCHLYTARSNSYVDEHGRPSSGGYIGWFMVVTHSRDKVLDYYLSNTHK